MSSLHRYIARNAKDKVHRIEVTAQQQQPQADAQHAHPLITHTRTHILDFGWTFTEFRRHT